MNYKTVNMVTSKLPTNDLYDATEPEMSSLLAQKLFHYIQIQSFQNGMLLLFRRHAVISQTTGPHSDD